MIWIKAGTGRAIALSTMLAWAGTAAAQQHHADHGKSPAAPAAKAAGERAGAAYRSAFADYRPFAEEPPKDWRRANDEVLEAGGHVGLLKGTNAQPSGHSGHGAKPPASAPAPTGKK